MPRISTINAEQLPTVESEALRAAPGEFRTVANYNQLFGATAAKWKSAQNFTQIANDFAHKWFKARDLHESEKARSTAKEAYAMLYEQMQTPEFRSKYKYRQYGDEFERRSKEIKQRINDAFDGTPAAKRSLGLLLNDIEGNYRVKTATMSRFGELDEMHRGIIDSLEKSHNATVKNFRDAEADPKRNPMKEVNKATADFAGYLAGMREAKVITPEQEKALNHNFITRTNNAIWREKIFRNPKQAVQMLKEPIEGMPEDMRVDYLVTAEKALAAKEKSSLSAAEKREKELEKINKQIKEEADFKAFQMYSNGFLNRAQLEILAAGRMITRPMYEKILDDMEKDEKDAKREENVVVKNILSNSIVAGEDVRNQVIKAYEKGELKVTTASRMLADITKIERIAGKRRLAGWFEPTKESILLTEEQYLKAQAEYSVIQDEYYDLLEQEAKKSRLAAERKEEYTARTPEEIADDLAKKYKSELYYEIMAKFDGDNNKNNITEANQKITQEVTKEQIKERPMYMPATGSINNIEDLKKAKDLTFKQHKLYIRTKGALGISEEKMIEQINLIDAQIKAVSSGGIQ